MRERAKRVSERLLLLKQRLLDLELKKATSNDIPIIEVGIQALKDKISEIGRTLRNMGAFLT